MRNWNILLKLFFAATVLINMAYALQEDNILPTMREKIESATKILQDSTLEKHKKQEKIFESFDSVFDYGLMSKLSLGKQWNSLDAKQKDIFTKSFEQKLKAAYIDKLYLYNNQEVIVKDILKLKDSRIELNMQIIGEKEAFEIIYKFYKDPSDEWFIYDVNILGVSIIQTYRNQFVGVLQKDSFEDLIERLNKVEAVTK